MGNLANHSSLEYVKALYLGDPGAGKTGSLTSLVAAGYRLCIFDFDNLLGTLVQYVKHQCPDKIGNVFFQTFTDEMKGSDTPLMMVGGFMKVLPFTEGVPKAFSSAMKQLNHWKTADEDLGDPAKFGKDTVLVIDTLSTLSMAAYRYCWGMNPGAKETQAVYFAAQQMVENVLALLFSEQVRTNVIVLAHIDYNKNQYEVMKGFPRAVGSALGPKIGGYFNCILQAEAVSPSKRVIHTDSTGIVDLKNPVSFKLPAKDLPLDTGLATFFEAVTGHKPTN